MSLTWELKAPLTCLRMERYTTEKNQIKISIYTNLIIKPIQTSGIVASYYTVHFAPNATMNVLFSVNEAVSEWRCPYALVTLAGAS